MSNDSKRLLAAWLVLCGVLVAGWATSLALPIRPVASLLRAQIAVPHSQWLARCSALPVDAVSGIEVLKVKIRPDRVSAMLRKDAKIGWLACNKLGVYSGAGVYACYGPTVLRDRMAADAACSHAIAWSAVKDLPAAAKEVIAPWLVCCGSWTVAGQARSDVPCSWVLEGKATGTLTGYGPGVVGADGPCAEYGGE